LSSALMIDQTDHYRLDSTRIASDRLERTG
jgi:hypothetical protein